MVVASLHSQQTLFVMVFDYLTESTANESTTTVESTEVESVVVVEVFEFDWHAVNTIAAKATIAIRFFIFFFIGFYLFNLSYYKYTNSYTQIQAFL